MSEKSPWRQPIGLIKRQKRLSASLAPAHACFHASKSLLSADDARRLMPTEDPNRKSSFNEDRKGPDDRPRIWQVLPFREHRWPGVNRGRERPRQAYPDPKKSEGDMRNVE